MISKSKIFLISILIITISCRSIPDYTPGPNPEFSTFDDFYKYKLWNFEDGYDIWTKHGIWLAIKAMQ